ncbi:MAG: ABC transporter substrate-binding protein, partial [Gemmatimonadales bacterium]|nr:ABC transporter substrate-binding protein [Gemmatimonadales bacterium]
MRVVSLLPAGTEIVAALGAGSQLVGISHECDWPPSITHLPRVTTTPIDPSQPGGAIDAQVRQLAHEGRPVIAVDAAMLQELRPDLILTQDLCAVCAVIDGDVREVTRVLDRAPVLLSLKARTLPGVFEDIKAVGAALDLSDEAGEVVAGLRYRLRRIAGARPVTQPRIVCVEWLDPIYLAGHWVPELIEAAGGVDVGAAPGAHSRVVARDELKGLNPDLILVALCGFGVERARKELERDGGFLGELGVPVWILDGNA